MNLDDYKSIVVLTGAGISAESGIQTFRDSGGLWEEYPVEEVATPEAFENDPVKVWHFYSLRRQSAARAKPNLAHISLAAFQKVHKDTYLITQNVDGLHLRAQTPTDQLTTMHGNLFESRCCLCHKVFHDDLIYFKDKNQECLFSSEVIKDGLHPQDINRDNNSIPLSPCCSAQLRPNIVWFGEIPMDMDLIQKKLKKCDLFITIGTSGTVYPAAGFLHFAKMMNAKTLCLNLEDIGHSDDIDLFIQGKATETVPKLFKNLG